MALSATISARDNSPQPIVEFVLDFQRTVTHRMANYCGGEVPSLRAAMQTALAEFDEKFDTASAIARARGGQDRELSSAMPPQAIKAFNEVEAEMMNLPNKMGSKEYCE